MKPVVNIVSPFQLKYFSHPEPCPGAPDSGNGTSPGPCGSRSRSGRLRASRSASVVLGSPRWGRAPSPSAAFFDWSFAGVRPRVLATGAARLPLCQARGVSHS